MLLRRNQASGESALPESVDAGQLSKVDYDALTAPFLYKLGDTLASYIETNTDVMNQLKPFEYEESSSDEEADDGGVGDEQLETEVKEDPREEEKEVVCETEQIDTSLPRVEQVEPNETSAAAGDGEKEEKLSEDLE